MKKFLNLSLILINLNCPAFLILKYFHFKLLHFFECFIIFWILVVIFIFILILILIYNYLEFLYQFFQLIFQVIFAFFHCFIKMLGHLVFCFNFL